MILMLYIDITINFILFSVSGSLRNPNITSSWIDMVTPCIKVLKAQVQVEFNASMEYLSMVYKLSALLPI